MNTEEIKKRLTKEDKTNLVAMAIIELVKDDKKNIKCMNITEKIKVIMAMVYKNILYSLLSISVWLSL